MPPADACPFRRPFPDDFDACQAYQPAQFVPLDTGYAPMGVHWTCGNLGVGVRPGQAHRHYARCRVGDAAARERWVLTVRGDRLERLRRLQSEFAPLASGFLDDLWGAKGRQLQALHSRDDGARRAATADLERITGRYLGEIDAFVEDNLGEFEALGMPAGALSELMRVLVDAWIAQPTTEVPVVPEEILGRFPDDVRALLRPDAA